MELAHHAGVFVVEDVAVEHVGDVGVGVGIEACGDDDFRTFGDDDVVFPAAVFGARRLAVDLEDLKGRLVGVEGVDPVACGDRPAFC